MRTAFRSLIAMLAAAGLLVAAPAARAHGGHHKRLTPMIFLHGGAGSGGAVRVAGAALHEQRLPAELHPRGRIRLDLRRRHARGRLRPARRRDRRPARSRPGGAKVDLLGHSLGTTLSHEYLASPARAANIARYVNIDGRTARRRRAACPRSRSGPAAERRAGRSRAPPTSRSRTRRTCRWPRPRRPSCPSTSSSPAASRRGTSRPSTGSPCRAGGAVPAERRRGRAHARDLGGARRHRAAQGQAPGRDARHRRRRLVGPGSRAEQRQALRVRPRRRGAVTHHIYFEPFKRSSHLVRLLTSEPGGGVEHPDREEPAPLGPDDRQVQGALGRPGRRERRPRRSTART